MGRRTWSKCLSMAAVMPLFVAAVLPTHTTTLVCRFTGLVMDMEACCPSGSTRAVPVNAQLLDETCCIVKTVDLAKVVSERRSESAQLHAQEILAPASVARVVAFPVRPCSRGDVRPPPLGPPILLVKRAFLI